MLSPTGKIELIGIAEVEDNEVYQLIEAPDSALISISVKFGSDKARDPWHIAWIGSPVGAAGVIVFCWFILVLPIDKLYVVSANSPLRIKHSPSGIKKV